MQISGSLQRCLGLKCHEVGSNHGRQHPRRAEALAAELYATRRRTYERFGLPADAGPVIPGLRAATERLKKLRKQNLF